MEFGIPRERLVRSIERASEKPVVVLLAPAGCGKSVALQQYLAALPLPYARYDVRPEHETLLGFVRGMTDALHEIAPEARGTLADAFAGIGSSDAPAIGLAAWMNEHLAHFRGVIAVDDLHRTDADPESSRFLAALIERTKDRVKWILASRSMLRLSLGSWLAYGIASAPIDQAALALTDEEARNFARTVRPDLADLDIDRLRQTTSGWVTAFGLALQLLETPADIGSALAMARRLSYQYLSEHVYNAIGQEERALLEFAMLLPRIDVELLELAGFHQARASFDRISSSMMFVSVDPASDAASPRFYRCHDLLRDYLDHELQLRDERVRNELYLRAARVLRSTDPVAALRLCAKARAFHDVLSTLSENGFELLEQAHGDTIGSCMDLLPETEQSSAIVLGLRAQQEVDAGHFDRAMALFERALSADASPALRVTLVERACVTLINTGKDPVPLLESVSLTPDVPSATRTSMLSLLAAGHAHFGRPQAALEVLNELEPMVWQVDSEVARLRVLVRIGAAAYFIGDVARARRTLEQADHLAARVGAPRTASMVYGLLGVLALSNDDDLESGKRFARLEAEAATRAGKVQALRGALVKQLYVALREGDRKHIDEVMMAVAPLSSDARASTSMREVEGMLAAWDGDFAGARSAFLLACNSFYDIEEERSLDWAFAALFAAAEGQRTLALTLAADVEKQRLSAAPSQRPSFARNHETARLLCALTVALAGRPRTAQRMLREEPLSTTPFLVELRALAAIAARDAEPGISPADLTPHFEAMRLQHYGGYARALEKVLTALLPRIESPGLTPAELTVLRLLAGGQSPKDVAMQTELSIHTVRTHTRNIIRKFGCSGRDQAIRMARSTGILES